MSKYINEFMNMRCAPDILSISGTMKDWPKEISEAMAIRKLVKEIVLKEPSEWVHLDLCSGNALAPILSAFSLPVEYALAVDKQERDRNWNKIRKFWYYNFNLFEKEFKDAITFWRKDNYKIIFTAIHACKDTAKRIIEIYNDYSGQKYLFLMPCCIGKYEAKVPQFFQKKFSDYEQWAYYLYELIDSDKKDIVQDTHIISPRNIILKAEG